MQELQFMYPELNLIPDEVLDGIQVYNFSQYVKELKVVKKYIDPSRKMLKLSLIHIYTAGIRK